MIEPLVQVVMLCVQTSQKVFTKHKGMPYVLAMPVRLFVFLPVFDLVSEGKPINFLI
jgi:hypothetical protein